MDAILTEFLQSDTNANQGASVDETSRAIQSAWPCFEGFFRGLHMQLVYTDEKQDNDDRGEELFAPYWDEFNRKVVLPRSFPWRKPKAAGYLYQIFVLGALSLDTPSRCILEGSVSNGLCTATQILSQCAATIFTNWSLHGPEETPNGNGRLKALSTPSPSSILSDLVETRCRWECLSKTQHLKYTLESTASILYPVTAYVVPSSNVTSTPSVPDVYAPMERLRQRLLRSIAEDAAEVLDNWEATSPSERSSHTCSKLSALLQQTHCNMHIRVQKLYPSTSSGKDSELEDAVCRYLCLLPSRTEHRSSNLNTAYGSTDIQAPGWGTEHNSLVSLIRKWWCDTPIAYITMETSSHSLSKNYETGSAGTGIPAIPLATLIILEAAISDLERLHGKRIC